MNELEISGQPHQQQQEPAGPRGGWEGAAAEGGDGGDGGEAGPSGRAAVDETAVKLDSMMELTLEHLARRCDGGACMGVCARTVVQGGARRCPPVCLVYVRAVILWSCSRMQPAPSSPLGNASP